MATAQTPTLISDYSQAYTSLQAGKRELIQCGADAMQLNRFVVDAADSTAEADPKSVLQAIDLNKVVHGDSQAEREQYCHTLLNKLIGLQEEVVLLQKSARESGISAGLLTIVGQAATQSPGDNGASVLRQLSDLVEETDEGSTDKTIAKQEVEDTSKVHHTAAPANVSPDEAAANDHETSELDDPAEPLGLLRVVREHWAALVIDASVCAIATGIAISLII